jgi:membrane fusion protein (multidrug efflux system)
VIPEQALIATRAGYMVFVVGKNGSAVARPVEIGLREPGLVQITEGLSAGERVVKTGHLRVADGTPKTVRCQNSGFGGPLGRIRLVRCAPAAPATDRRILTSCKA